MPKKKTRTAKKKPSKHKYDESKIKTLSSLEHIRLRTGMYIGRTGDGGDYNDGIYILLKEVIDNAVDEFIMGAGNRIDIVIANGKVTVRDFGRGIPLGKVIECVSKINTGAKYNDDVFQFSVGLNGVGTKAVNALSKQFVVRSHRDGKYVEARFEKGKKKGEKKGRTKEANGTYIAFTPDPSIFENYAFCDEHIERRMAFYAFLNAGLKLVCNGKTHKSEEGILDLVQVETTYERIYKPLHYRDKMLDIAFTHTNRFSEQYFSFVNGQHTSDGGTHLSAFKEGLLKGLNVFSTKKFDGSDVREGILGAVAIRLQEPIFESQTKNKLCNTEIRGELTTRIRDAVADLLHRNEKIAAVMIEKIEETQRIRKELTSVKKLARDKSKAVSIRVPQLRDCKEHLDIEKQAGLSTMIFITEGQSAAGSLVSCRDVLNQAIFTLKGKPLNVWNLNKDALYKNDELYNLMRCLNIEDNVDNLRYQKVILATDADVDGLHIRNLMITFFLRFFKQVVEKKHLFILETPLFRVRDKKRTIYCYSEAERDAATKTIGRGAETTRFKGLGEISPNEFKGFISGNMNLRPVVLGSEHSIEEVLSFYMGKNTIARRQYIMDSLVAAQEN